MAKHHLPNLKINKDNPEKGIKDLIRIIKPSWDQDDINMEVLSGGYSSQIYRCFSTNKNDKITVRIESLMGDHQEWKCEDVKAIQHLSLVGHFPTVHACFANGYCYQYIEGNSVMDMRKRVGSMDEEILQAAAKEMAFVHSVKLSNTEYKQSVFFKKIKGLVVKSPAVTLYDVAPSKDELLRELDILDNYFISLNSPLALMHGDCHPGNYLWNDAEKKITFVDWEVASIGYQYQDIAYLFQFMRLLSPTISPAVKLTLPDDMESKFLKYYFDEWCVLNNTEVHKEEYAKFVENIYKFQLIGLVSFCVFGLYFSPIFEALFGPGNTFYKSAVNCYLQLRKELFGSGKFGDPICI